MLSYMVSIREMQEEITHVIMHLICVVKNKANAPIDKHSVRYFSKAVANDLIAKYVNDSFCSWRAWMDSTSDCERTLIALLSPSVITTIINCEDLHLHTVEDIIESTHKSLGNVSPEHDETIEIVTNNPFMKSVYHKIMDVVDEVDIKLENTQIYRYEWNILSAKVTGDSIRIIDDGDYRIAVFNTLVKEGKINNAGDILKKE